MGAAACRHPGRLSHGMRSRGTDALPCRAVLTQYDAFKWMGCAIIFVACVGVAPLYFPMWGGLFCGPQPGVTEEDYYYAEYSPAEREKGMHLAASNFVRPLRHMTLYPTPHALGRLQPCARPAPNATRRWRHEPAAATAFAMLLHPAS